MSEQQNVVDKLTEQLRASTVTDGAASEDWKQNLNLPPRDSRQQTEVRPRYCDIVFLNCRPLPLRLTLPLSAGCDEYQGLRIRGLQAFT